MVVLFPRGTLERELIECQCGAKR